MENTEKKENSVTGTELINKINELCAQRGWTLHEYSFDYNKEFGQCILTVKMY